MMQDAWRDNWQPRNVFPSSRSATSFLGVSLAINPLENRWPIKSCVQGEPPLINADCQGASLMYFSFKESVSNAHCIGEFLACSTWAEREVQERREIVMRGSFLILPALWMKMFTRAKVTEIGQKIKVFAWMPLNVQKVFRFEATLLTDIKSNQITLKTLLYLNKFWAWLRQAFISKKKIRDLRIHLSCKSFSNELIVLQTTTDWGQFTLFGWINIF